MAETTPARSGEGDRPRWLPWSAFPFQSRFAEIAGSRVHCVRANADTLDGFIDALDPQDITVSASTGPASVVTPVTARPP